MRALTSCSGKENRAKLYPGAATEVFKAEA
jgi:hypothetical protein